MSQLPDFLRVGVAQAAGSASLARVALSAGNPAALALVAAASYDALRVAGVLACWRPASGRRPRAVVALCDQLEQAGRRGLLVASGAGGPGEGAEIVAALQYALAVLAGV